MTLRTVDEAVNELGRSVLAVADTTSCSLHRLEQLLGGAGTLRGLSPGGRTAVTRHRALLAELREISLGWLLDDQLEGALSYASERAA